MGKQKRQGFLLDKKAKTALIEVSLPNADKPNYTCEQS